MRSAERSSPDIVRQIVTNITVYCLMAIPSLLHRAEKALLPIFSEIDAQVKENLAKILLGKYGEAIDFPK